MTELIAGVLFDLDNTLAARDQAFAAWLRWFARDRLGLDPADPATEATVARLLARGAGGHNPKAAFFQAIKADHPALADAAADLLAEFRRQLPDHLPPLDVGAAGLLAALDRAGIPWGVVTNGAETQYLKLRRLGLEGRSPCVVVSEVVGVHKPDPAIFRLAAGHLGLDPAAILFVGDHPRQDIVGAGRVGMRTAWLRRGRAWPAHLAATPPTYQIDEVAELRGVVGLES